MNTVKRIVAIGATASMLLWSVGTALPVGAVTIADGDLVSSADSSAVYYIQGAYKRVFPHANVYFSWGYADFSSVKTVSASELSAYADANAMVFRDGSLFRGTAASLGGKDASAVFYVEDAMLRPVLSEAIYMALFNDASWSKVTWVPDDLLTKFSYDMGSDLTSSATHPNGALVSYTGDSQVYLIEGGQKRAISDASFAANRYKSGDVLAIDASETYADGSAITGVESGLLTPGWSGITTTSALTASLYNTASATTMPDQATNVPLLGFKLTAGSSAVTVTGLTFKRTGLGAYGDWNTVYIYAGSTNITPTGRSLSSDDHTVEFAALNISVPANSSKMFELRGDLIEVNASTSHTFQLTAVETSASISGLPLTGNQMVVGNVDVSSAVLTDGAAPINPSVGAQAIEVAKFKIEANGDNDLSFSQAVFTFTGTINRSEVTNLNLYLLGESASLASVSGIDTNDTFTMTLSSPYVITKGFTRTFLLRADLAGEVAQTLKIYIDETNHLVINDNQYNFGALVTNTFDSGDAATLALQGGEITLTDNGPSADSIAKNQQDVVLAKIAMTAERAVEVRKLFVTLATSTFNNPADGVSDLRIKDEDTGQTLMTYSTALAVGSDFAGNFLMTGTFNLTAGTTRNLTITVDIGVDTGDVLNGQSVTADLKIVDRGDDSIATGATSEEAQMRDVITGDWVLTADIIPLIVSGNAQTIEDATLTITESSTPVTGLTVVKGASNVEAIGFVLTSGDASTSLVRQLAARVYVNSANDFAKATNDTSPNGEVISVALYDGSTKLSEKTITSTSSSGHDYGAVIFDNLNVFIEAGANKKLTIMFNVSASAQASFVAIGVLPGDITAYDADGNDVIATAGTGEVNVYTGTDDSIKPDNSTEIKASGELTMSIDASSPDSDIVLAGTSDVVMSKIKLTATNEAWTVNKLRILIDNTGNEGSVSSVKIAFSVGNTVTTLTGFLASGFVNFTGLNWVIEADTEEILTITADLATIDPNIATTGRELKFGIVEAAGFEAVGESSTTLFDFSNIGADVFGNPMTLRKTRPTIAGLTLPSDVLTNGTNIINKFTVTADAAGTLTVKQFSWDINIGEVDGADLKFTDWKFYENGVEVAGFWSDKTATSTSGAVPLIATDSPAVLIFEADSEVEVAAGATTTFELKANATNVAVEDASISSSLLNDDNDLAVRTGGLVDDAVNGADLEGPFAVDFLWSDKARGVNHTDSYQDTYDDWTNGYLIDEMPTPTYSLTF